MEHRGFTLVEMIVAVALFAIVMLVAVGSLLSITVADRKAQALQSVMNDLNVSLDSMVRNIRMGTEFHCGVGAYQGGGADDCSGGGEAFTFTCNPLNAACASSGVRWAYAYDKDGTRCGGSQTRLICKSEDGGRTWQAITSPAVTITSMKFYVVGTATARQGTSDTIQPKTIIVVSGQAGGADVRALTTFHIQATAVQRELDL